MKTYARIDGGLVVELFSTDGDMALLFNPALVWVDTGGAPVQQGWSYAAGMFTAPPAPTLAQVQAAQIAKMVSAYQGAIAQDVSFTSAASVTKLFQADQNSVANAQAMLTAYKTAVPAGFYWVSKDNTQVPFALADLQGLAKAMGDQGWAAFQNLQTRKASILAATTIAAVQAIAW